MAYSISSLRKGLVLDMPLREVDEKVGSELHTDANAISDPNGNEANATTGWDNRHLTTGANVFESQSSVKSTGSYAFHLNSNDTPTGAANINKDIGTDMSLVTGKTYRISFKWRHVGTGGNWAFRYGSNTSLSGYQTVITPSDTTFTKYKWDFVYDSNHRYMGFQENSFYNSGGVYVDDLSVKELKTADTTPNSNHGVVHGATQNSEDMSFGTTTYIELPSSVDVSGIKAVSLRFYLDNLNSANNLFVWGNGDSTDFLKVNVRTDGRIIAAAGNATGYSLQLPLSTITTGTWYHIVVNKVEGGVSEVYLDGVESSETATNYNSFTDSKSIGHSSFSTDGNIKNVKVYNRALTADEVLLDYKGAGQGGLL